VLSDDVTRKVRALLDRANHARTPRAEATLAMAYRLVAKYDLNERLLASQKIAIPLWATCSHKRCNQTKKNMLWD
jgi:hypothetical protein